MSEEAPVVLRIGAAIDSTIEKSFATIEERAIKANQNILKANERAAKQLAKGAQQAAGAAEKSTTQQEAAASRLAARQEKEAARAARAAERAAAQESSAAERSAKARERASAQATTAALRGFDQIGKAARAAESAELRASQASNRRLGQRFASSTANTATRFLAPYAPLASMARRTGADLLRGFGVDLDVGSAIKRNVERESLSTALSNSGFQELRAGQTAGPNNTLVAGSTLAAEAKDIGIKTATDSTEVLSGERAFVGITGNLDQARKGMFDFAKISKATNADLTDVSKAAAKINAQMDDTPTKAEDTLAVVRLLAGQGKLGAAEMADYAKSIGQIAGQSHRFKGDVTSNIAELSAMAQLSVQRGFSKSPVQAATSISAFANVFSNSANVKNFAKHGITEKQLQNMGPEQIIKTSLLATKGDNVAMGSLFKNQRARAVTLPFEQAFNNATGGKTDTASLQAGIRAVDAEFARLKDGAMSSAEVDKEFANQMGTTKSKVQQFQTQLDGVVEGVQAKLLPALTDLAPHVLEFAEVLGKASTWVLENPKQAIGAAIGLSIARAGIESTLRAGIERMLLGESGQNAGALGRVAGAAGAAFAITSLAVTTLTVGEAIIDMWATKDKKNQQQGAEGLSGAASEADAAEKLLQTGDIEGAKKHADAAKDKAESGLQAVGDPAENQKRLGLMRGVGLALLGPFELLFDKKLQEVTATREAADNQEKSELLKEQQRSNTILQTIASTLARLPPQAGGGGGDALPPGGRSSQL